MTIQRWDLAGGCDGESGQCLERMERDDGGDYVLYVDVVAYLAAADKQIAHLIRAGDELQRTHCNSRCFAIKNWVIAKATDAKGGSDMTANNDACPKCGQIDVGQTVTGEYPCPECHLPTMHDDSSALASDPPQGKEEER